MSKAIAILVALSDVIWFPERNYGKDVSLFDNEESRNKRSVMLSGGWSPSMAIQVVEISEDDKKRAIEILTRKREILASNLLDSKFVTEEGEVTVSASDILRAFDENWFEKGKPKTPKYEAIWGFQRGECLVGSVALARKQNRAAFNQLPVVVEEFATEYDRRYACIYENTSKMALVKDVTTNWPSLFKAGHALYEARKLKGTPAKEIDITRCISGGEVKRFHGTGQRLYAMLVLDSRFPKLGIASRVMDGEKGNKFAQPLKYTAMHELIAKDATSEAVEAYFADPRNGETAPVVMPKKSDIEAYAKQTSNVVIRYILESLTEYGDLSRLNKFELVSDEMNKLLPKLGITLQTKAELDKKVSESIASGVAKS